MGGGERRTHGQSIPPPPPRPPPVPRTHGRCCTLSHTSLPSRNWKCRLNIYQNFQGRKKNTEMKKKDKRRKEIITRKCFENNRSPPSHFLFPSLLLSLTHTHTLSLSNPFFI